MGYSLGMWTNKTHYSSVKKFGSDGDKDQLTDPGRQNKEMHEGAKRKRKAVATARRHPVRQDKRRIQAKERQRGMPLPESEEERLGVPLPARVVVVVLAAVPPLVVPCLQKHLRVLAN